MSSKVTGNISGMTASERRIVEKLYTRKIDKEDIVPADLAKEVCLVAEKLNRRVGLLVSREGHVEEVFLGKRDILYLPDLGRYRFGTNRLRRLRLIFSDLSRNTGKANIPQDIFTDLEKLRLDCVVSLRAENNKILASYAYLMPNRKGDGVVSHSEETPDLSRDKLDFSEFIEEIEDNLAGCFAERARGPSDGVLLVGVYESNSPDNKASMEELTELARTAGLKVVGSVVQIRKPDPRTILGAGKLEEVVLTALRLAADYVIFDSELKPAQWKNITKDTDLKVLDRSMLILDIFAQRASSSDGRLQVELAQLKYNLPRLTEMDSGLSRLSGGIGGRGPGETKLEVSRRVVRDKISDLEKRINKLKEQRFIKKKRRLEGGIPLVAIVGYTNVGKSTLFNLITKSQVLAENKLFATLDPAKRRIFFDKLLNEDGRPKEVVVSDTVGFIRELPEELYSAFRATLEEIGDATLLVHVLDGSDSQIEARKESVEKILSEMGFSSIPSICVINKIDKISEERLSMLKDMTGGIGISAVKKIGIDQLMDKMLELIA